MLGFKCFDHATITIAGIELIHQIKKSQFDVSAVCSPQTRMPQVWEAVLAAFLGSGIQVMLASKGESITLRLSRAFMQHATGGALPV